MIYIYMYKGLIQINYNIVQSARRANISLLLICPTVKLTKTLNQLLIIHVEQPFCSSYSLQWLNFILRIHKNNLLHQVITLDTDAI